VLKRRKYCWRN